MAEFTLSQVVEATAGMSAHTDNIKFLDVSTDTRTIESGFLFVALKGDTFDGHDFINTAIEKGATGAIVEKGRAVEGIVCIEVENFNNEIGLPKTLLRLTAEHEACVVEMGMRGLGQIEELALIAEPTMGIITNVGTSHIELLGSREAIAEAKGELIRCLPENSVAILNEDDPYVKAMDSLAKGKTITYGIERNATCIGSHLRYKKDGIKFTCKCYDEVFDIFLPMIGEHNVYDALAAIVAGRVLGIKSNTIRKGLSEFTGTPMRQEIVPFEDIVILNDAYNANPSSMAEAIKALGQLEGKRKIAMLGDMLELGDFSEDAHREIGQLLAEEGYSVVFTFGDAAAFIAKEAKKAGLTTFRCNSHLEMANAYSDIREKGDVILVKGSRGLRMERVVEELKDRE